jgi:hypothetical protein
MNRQTAEACRPCSNLSNRVMTSRIITCAVVGIWIGVTFNGPILEAATVPTADEVLQELNISDSDRQGIREGKIVKWTASEGSDRELAIGMALLVKAKPSNLVELFREASAFKVQAAITAHGKITGDGTLADFARVKLEPNGEKEAQRYLNVEPGDELNLDAKEIAAFRAMKPTGGNNAVSVKEVEAQVRQTLLSRYQAYHTKGFSGITPYQRGGGRQVLASDELSLSVKQMRLLAKYVLSVYDVLLNYPAGKTKDDDPKLLEEQFYWLNLDLFGRPTYVLSHRMLFRVGEAYVSSERHFYTSHDYNSLQQGIAALPTKDGTLVLTLVRVSTDQVGGFGSSAKHPVSRTLMGPFLKDMYEALRAKAEKQ